MVSRKTEEVYIGDLLSRVPWVDSNAAAADGGAAL